MDTIYIRGLELPTKYQYEVFLESAYCKESVLCKGYNEQEVKASLAEYTAITKSRIVKIDCLGIASD